VTTPSPGRAVLFVSVPTGVGGSTRSLANLLSAVDGDVERILVGPAYGRFVSLVTDLHAAERQLPLISSRSPRAPRRAWSAIRIAAHAVRHRHELAAIHANGLKELSLCLPAAVLSRVRLVVWVHNFRLPPSVRIFGWLWRLLLPLTDVRWAAVSPLSRDLVADARLVRPADVEIVPNPIDPADLLVARAVEDTGSVNVAYLGAPRQYKGFQFLPDIVEAVGSELPVQWLVFSRPTDDDLAETWARLRELASGGTVSIEGKFTDVREAYARCDIVVCPSLWDSFCRVAAEAMLNGIPVVGSDLEPIQDLLGDDEAGLVFARGEVAECAKAVTRLVSDPGLRARLGAAGRTRAAAFAPDTVRGQMLALYGVPTARPA
jgi:glycosyltransferase involved in cell wall biosynthesis